VLLLAAGAETESAPEAARNFIEACARERRGRHAGRLVVAAAQTHYRSRAYLPPGHPTRQLDKAVRERRGLWNFSSWSLLPISSAHWEAVMNGLIYLIGLIVVIMFILSFLGLR
jgi:hypothetical protein